MAAAKCAVPIFTQRRGGVESFRFKDEDGGPILLFIEIYLSHQSGFYISAPNKTTQ